MITNPIPKRIHGLSLRIITVVSTWDSEREKGSLGQPQRHKKAQRRLTKSGVSDTPGFGTLFGLHFSPKDTKQLKEGLQNQVYQIHLVLVHFLVSIFGTTDISRGGGSTTFKLLGKNTYKRKEHFLKFLE